MGGRYMYSDGDEATIDSVMYGEGAGDMEHRNLI